MKVAIISLFVMMCVMSDHMSDVQGEQGSKKKESPNQVEELKELLEKHIAKEEETENQVEELKQLLQKHIAKTEETEKQVEELKGLLEKHIAKSDQLACCCRSETTLTSAATTDSSVASTSTTTITTTSITTTSAEGILITGGKGAEKSTEVFIPETGKTCILPDFRTKWGRNGHTLDNVANTTVLCGGGPYMSGNRYSCLHFTPTSEVVWKHYALSVKRRHGHTSWVSSAGLVLVGGWNSPRDTDIVNVPSGGGNFSLLQDTRFACAIADKDSTILTGGYKNATENMKVVARYNLQGHVENLPEMNLGRRGHGCGSYQSGGTMVLLVVGGFDGSKDFSSTETMTIGATGWTTIKPLPRALHGTTVAIVTIDNKIFLTGGQSGVELRSEILTFEGEDWKEVGQLQIARAMHAVTKIDTTDIMRFCN